MTTGENRPAPLGGIHHITALASDPQRNADFYAGLLGLRLVKQTVNFDAPDVYHLYYGDTTGRPGTILTFFPFPGAGRGRRGVSEISSVAFSIPPASMLYWVNRLSQTGTPFDGPTARNGEEIMSVHDPEGMTVELVADPSAELLEPWKGGPVDADHTLRRIAGATLMERNGGPTGTFLVDVLGFRKGPRDGGRSRFFVGEGETRANIDLVENPREREALQAAGSIHHVAWSVPDDAAQLDWHDALHNRGTRVTHVQDRRYFRSIYFSEPGGVLFEIATDVPGFTIDESVDDLGSGLRLPPWIESQRGRIEQRLPPLSTPAYRVRA